MSALAFLDDLLSAHFLTPVSFAWLGLIPLVVLLYLLKLRRTEIVIASTLLWTKNLQDLTANAPFQRLRKNLLLFLQILILLLLITALARPFVQQVGAGGKSLCLLIDRSASMSVMENDRSRLERAKQAALEMVDALQDGDKAMVVAFGAKSDVLSDLTDDRGRLRHAISGIQPSDTRSNLRDAILLVRSLRPDNPKVPSVVPDLEVVLLSDGKVSDLEEIGPTAINLSYLKIGETSFNAGIVAFTIRMPSEGEGERQAFVLVRNEAEQPLSTTLTLSLDGRVLGVSEIHVPPKSDREVLFGLSEVESGVLLVELDHKDALDVDNRAWLTLRPRAKVKVLLVAKDDSPAAYFLKHALGLDPRAATETVSPEDYTDTGAHDLTIFDGWAPPELPRGCLVFINVVPPVTGLQAEGKVDKPPVLAIDSEHPLTRLLNPEAVRIGEALKLTLPEGARTLISTTGGPLIADVSRAGRHIAVVAFDLAKSNWPLNLSFPLFIQNLLAWAPSAAISRETSVSTGGPLTIMPVPQADHATVTLPDGTTRRIEMAPLRPAFFAGTEKAGVYRVTCGNESVEYAVNLLDRNESSITPASSLRIGRGEVVGQTEKIKQDRELWRWLIVFAIVVLVTEWWIFSRRAWI